MCIRDRFTEVGYVGKEVDSIIRDLVDTAVKMARETEKEKVRFRAEEAAEERILDILVPSRTGTFSEEGSDDAPDYNNDTRQKFRKKLREGDLNDTEIEIDLAATPMGVEIMTPPGMEEMADQLTGMFKNMNTGKKKTRKMRIEEAMKALTELSLIHI